MRGHSFVLPDHPPAFATSGDNVAALTVVGACSPGMTRSSRAAAPRTVGHAGVGLEDTSWAVNDAVARVGRDGELRTEELLSKLAGRRDGATVIHDLTIPIPGFKANIDHAVISGRKIVLIDTKVWKPGRYWTFGGKTRRGREKVPHVDKTNPQMGFDTISRFLKNRGIAFTMTTPLIAVWSSSKRTPVQLFWLRIPGAATIRAEKLLRKVNRSVGSRPADPAIVAALAELVVGAHRPITRGVDPRSQQMMDPVRLAPPAQSVAPAGQLPIPPHSPLNSLAAPPAAPQPPYLAPIPPPAPIHTDNWFA